MPAKKKEEPHISNINNNNIHVNVNVEKSAKKRTKSAAAEKKPNWALKAIVLGLIGLVISVGGYYLKKQITKGNNKPAEIENGAAPISGTPIK